MKIENKYLELKETKTTSYLKTVSAFANYNDGEIRFGIDDQGNVKPIENMESTYVAILDLIDFKLTLEGCNEQYVNINFGDNTAFVITRGMVANVIPEIGEN